jgi:hypothetical protein
MGIVNQHMPHLSKPQAVVLALWSFGIVMSKSCGLTTVSVFIASVLGQKENTVRQRLREWYREDEAKKGLQRAEVDVRSCFVPLVRWVLSWWASEEKRLALTLDASTLGQLFVVLAISIVYRGCAIPVGWVLVPATTKGEWKKHWLGLFEQLEEAVPHNWTVVVLADRGLYADWLYQEIVRIGWHPFLRLKTSGTFRPQGQVSFRSLALVAPTVGTAWCGWVTCFKTNPLECTLLARWDEGYEDPWLIITDLEPQQADALWYAMRPWIECGFKQTKRAGWQWQNTRMTDPDRASRLWLAMAVATLWVVSVGGQAEATLPASSFEDLPESHIARRRTPKPSQPRLLSCFRRGILVIIAALMTGQPLPLGGFLPEPWPTSTSLPDLAFT